LWEPTKKKKKKKKTKKNKTRKKKKKKKTPSTKNKEKPYANKTHGYEMTINNTNEDQRRESCHLPQIGY